MVVEVRFSQLLIRLKSPYLPSQRSCGTVKFSQVSVSHSVHRGRGVCLSACWDTSLRQVHPLQAGSPPGQVHPSARYTLQAGSHPWAGTHPLAGTPPGRYTPLQVHPGQVHRPQQVHPQQVHTSLGQVHPPGRYIPLGSFSPHPHPHDSHCSGRYASYWNAFLFVILIERVMLRI